MLSAHRYRIDQIRATDFRCSRLGFLHPENVSFAQRRSSCRQCGEVAEVALQGTSFTSGACSVVGTDVTLGLDLGRGSKTPLSLSNQGGCDLPC